MKGRKKCLLLCDEPLALALMNGSISVWMPLFFQLKPHHGHQPLQRCYPPLTRQLLCTTTWSFLILIAFFLCALCPQNKLEEALKLATDFHNSLQDFMVWLTQAEQTLNMVSPASLILETILFQIDEHKVIFVLPRCLQSI